MATPLSYVYEFDYRIKDEGKQFFAQCKDLPV